jgi:hypothetical protein
MQSADGCLDSLWAAAAACGQQQVLRVQQADSIAGVEATQQPGSAFHVAK